MSTKTDLSWRTLGRPNLDLRTQRIWKTLKFSVFADFFPIFFDFFPTYYKIR